MQSVCERSRARQAPRIAATMPDGSVYRIARLLTGPRDNAKFARSAGHGYRIVGLSLAPHKLAGLGNLCAHASPGCVRGCVHISGMSDGESSVSDGIVTARIARARAYFQGRPGFLARLRHELAHERDIAHAQGERLAFRPNVFSDLDWARLHPRLVAEFDDVRWFGYTKDPRAMVRSLDGAYPAHYHLTFSRSEENEPAALGFLRAGGSVAVVFDTRYHRDHKSPLPAEWHGFPVIDGDASDLRFLDPPGCVVGLRAKGRLRGPHAIATGFVVPTDRDPVAPRVIYP